MDIETLNIIFTGTFNPDSKIRYEAESKLTELMKQPSFVMTCLDLISNNQCNNIVKLSAAINVKNLINKKWSTSTDEKDQFFQINDKVIIRNELLKIISQIVSLQLDSNDLDPSGSRNIDELLLLKKNQLLPTLSIIISYDCLNRDLLMNLFEAVKDSLDNLNFIPKLYIGLFCLNEICKNFKWSSNSARSQKIDHIIESTFPILIQIATSIINNYSFSNNLRVDELYGEILKFCIKCFKNITYIDLPLPLQNKEIASTWIDLHLQIIRKQLPKTIFELQQQGAHSNYNNKTVLSQWLKSVKWSYANLYRLFQQYGTPLNSLTASSNKEKKYLEFKILYLDESVPNILSLYFQIIQKWCNNDVYLSDVNLYYIILFLDHSIKIKKLWKLYFKDNVGDILEQFLFPNIIMSDSMLSISEEDPMEFINATIGNFSTDMEGNSAALTFITSLAEQRQEHCLPIILKFCHQSLINLNNDKLQDCKKIDAIFKIVGAISHIVSHPKNKFFENIKDFIKNFIIPNIFNRFGFLRMSSLELISKFAIILEEDNEIIYQVYQGILINLRIVQNDNYKFVNLSGEQILDPASDYFFPIEIAAALTLQGFIHFENLKELLSENVIQMMQKLLKLVNDLELDMLSGVMQEIVENFSQQLQPFGIELIKNLTNQIINIFSEADIDSKHSNEDFDYEEVLDPDKSMMVTGILGTIITILLSFENSPDSIGAIESILSDVLRFIFTNNLYDFYDEAFECLEDLVMFNKTISENIWDILNVAIIQNNFKSEKRVQFIMGYNDSLTNFLNICITYGSDTLLSNNIYLQNFIDLLKIIIHSGFDADNFDFNNLKDFNSLSANLFLMSKSNNLNLLSLSVQTVIIHVNQSIIKSKASNQNIDHFTQLVNSGDSASAVKYHKNYPEFISVYKNEIEKPKAVKISIINIICSSLIYDINGTFEVLNQYDMLEPFFEMWFNSISKNQLSKVYDLKISTLAILALLRDNSNNQIIAMIFPQLIGAFSSCLRKIPEAIKKRDECRKGFPDVLLDYTTRDQLAYENMFNAYSDNLTEPDDDYEDDNWLEQEQALQQESQDQSSTGLNFHNETVQSFTTSNGVTSDDTESNDDEFVFEDGFEDDDGAFENALFNDPLDSLNIFDTIKESLILIELLDFSKYQLFINGLTDGDKLILHNLKQ